MIALDTNILVYAHREESAFFNKAYSLIKQLSEGHKSWAIPWPSIHEFLAIVTHSRIYSPPTPLKLALIQVESWMESPTLRLITEQSSYWATLTLVLKNGKINGGRVHDARIAAICIQNGVDVLWSADRDFSRFHDLKVINPLINPID